MDRIAAAWNRLPSLLRITIESAALAVALDMAQKISGYTAPADQPMLAFLVNEAKIIVPIVVPVLRGLQNARCPAE